MLGWMNSKATKATVDKVQHALTETNSGSTVKDALNRVEGALAEIKGTQVQQGTSLTTLTDRVSALDAVPPLDSA